MTGSNIIFYLLAALTLMSALVAVSSRHIFRAAIALLFALIGIAGIYFWLDYQFIAAVQVVVYVGGIVVLIIFSVFLTQQAGEKLAVQNAGRKIFSGLAVCCGFALTMVQLSDHTFPSPGMAVVPGVSAIGKEMLDVNTSGLALPFEVISMLLLAAMVGCIVIAMRSKSVDAGEI